jgi:hypothetical protein
VIGTRMRSTVVALGLMTTALGVAAPASAEPGDDPCQLAATFLCRFVPMAPDLDHDIDLTQQPGTAVDAGPPAAPTNTDQR